MKIFREIPPLNKESVFVIEDYPHPKFGYPLHNHPEYELCITLNSTGNRIIGDSISNYTVRDMVLVGPYLQHRWDDLGNIEQRKNARILLIYFDQNIFTTGLIDKDVFFAIKNMLNKSKRGIQFSVNTIEQVVPRVLSVKSLDEFSGVLEFLSILNTLAHSEGQRLLASFGYIQNMENSKKSRINEVYDFIKENYTSKIQISNAAEIANMSESAFSHYFKRCTRKNFTQYVLELRISHACKLLMETQDSINQICFKCGFNNISNFNRLFKKYKQITPLQYRQKIEHALSENSKLRYQLYAPPK